MWAIKERKSEYLLKALYHDDGIGVPDIHMTDNASNAKVFKSRKEADAIVQRIKDAGGVINLEVIRV